MNKILISVIIPVYNAGEYLQDTLTSILSQATPKTEVIVVDDGSYDNSLEICKSFSYYNNFNYISQDNLGAPSARNKGLSLSKGKYAYFFDADDIMMDGLLSELEEIVEKAEYDIIVGNYYRVNGSSRISEFKNIDKKRTLFSKYMMDPFPGCRIYKRETINKYQIYFEDIKIGQDLNYNLKFLGISSEILLLNRYFSEYRYVSNSISNSVDERIFDIEKSIYKCKEFYELHDVCNYKFQLMFLEGLKHINYQMIKILKIREPERAEKFLNKFKRIRKRITNDMRPVYNRQFMVKRIVIEILYLYYRFQIYCHIRTVRKEN